MIGRRDFFRAAAAATAASLCGGGAAAPLPRRQSHRDVVLFREGEKGPIDWFDQRPGDKVVALWRGPPARQTPATDVYESWAETWEVTGEPFWNTDGPRPVEAVPVRNVSGRVDADHLYYESGRYYAVSVPPGGRPLVRRL